MKESVSKKKTQHGAKYAQNLASRSVAKDEGWKAPQLQDHGTQRSHRILASPSQDALLPIILAGAPIHAWVVSDNLHNHWNSAQRVISCCVVLLFQYKCHDPWQRGVTMIAVHSSVILMPCVGRALWSYFSPQEYFTSEHIGSNYSPLFCCPSQMNQGMHWRKALSSLLQLFVESWWGCYWSLHVIRNWASQEDGAVFYHIQEKNNFQSFLQSVWCWWQQ